MRTLKLQVPKPLTRQLKRYARKNGLSLYSAGIIAIERIATSDPNDRIDSISDRLCRVEQHLSALMNQQSITISSESVVVNECNAQAELFLTDTEQQTRRNLAYQSWLNHFNNHPEVLEPGRTAHEIAALKASVV